MDRIKIDFPSSVCFSTEMSVRVSDLNYGGHVGNDNVLTLMHEARLRLLHKLGYKDELSLGGGIGTIISDAAISYKSESFYGDVINIDIAVNDFNKYGFDMYYRITKKDSGKDIAIGKTGIVCFNYDTRKVAPIPEKLLKALNC